MASVQVALRIRPMNAAELQRGARPIAHRLDEQVVVLQDPMQNPDHILRASRSREKSFVFDAAFDSTSTQETVYRATTQGLIASVISGCNATVFAYGPTGCGKTYTMLGTDSEPGVCARTLGDLFRAIKECSSDAEHEVSMSYLEIYNEVIRDLLSPSPRSLQLWEDSHGTIRVVGITQVSASSTEEVLQLLLKGNRRRTQEPTATNQTSSRSHAVLQVTVRGRGLRCGRLQLIDLAGSERAAWTQNRGQRMKEGAHINRSLLALGNCIKALSKPAGSAHVNYRDSKLTRLLKDSLSGNSHTVMIAHISPASTAFEESRCTLTYAQRAKSIRPTVKHNLLGNSPRGSIVANLHEDIQHLKHQLYTTPDPGKHRTIRYTQAQVQLRDKLLDACREQAALCQHLVQLEGTALHTRLAAASHLRVLTRWKRRAWRWGKEGQGEPGGPGESRRNMDMNMPEPPNVITARESFVALLEKQGRLQEQKVWEPQLAPTAQPHICGELSLWIPSPAAPLTPQHWDACRGQGATQVGGPLAGTLTPGKGDDPGLCPQAELERRFQQSQQRTRRLEEAVQSGSSSMQQQEALALLCRLHQLQLHNAELRSRSLLQGGTWHFPATATQPFNQHRASRATKVSTAARPQHQGQVSGCAVLTVPQHHGGDTEQHQKHRDDGHSASVPYSTCPRAEARCQQGQPGGDSHPPGGHPARPLRRRLAVGVQKAGGEGRAAGCRKEKEAAAAIRGRQPRGRWQQHRSPMRAAGDTSPSISPAPGRAGTHRSAASWQLGQGPPARSGGTPSAEGVLLKHSHPRAKQRAEHPSCPPQRPT
ncbi:LOW QUALITY PROTEIN: kinesin-like protein KIF19 [Excalfactoria chinensis]|uniref:LOW QUALITY PROTEIN: kinesin-like protein KIF19 n=1 Tax=Excalfactoria chinensis TaxID=46218 RepID=UPI003B3B01C2